MGPEAAVKIINRREIAADADPAAATARFADAYRERFANPYGVAARGYVDEIIEPAETRRWLIRNLAFARAKRRATPSRKHGNIPL
jgi:acetyl-CoA carboxylase carboxyltransferase component